MKIEDITIGDYVGDKDGFVRRVLSIESLRTVHVGIDKVKTGIVVLEVTKEEPKCVMTMLFDDVKPVPLSEDILIRIGFKYNSRSDKFILYGWQKYPMIKISHPTWMGWHTTVSNYGNKMRRPIHYLHELQHIYKDYEINRTIEL